MNKEQYPRVDGGPRMSLTAALLALSMATAPCGAAASGANAISAPDPQIEIRSADNRVTIKAHRVPIIDILRALSRHVPLEVVTSDSLDEPVVRVIENQPLTQALSRLLKHRNFLLQHAVGDSGDRRYTRLWIYSRDDPPPEVSPMVRIRTEHHVGGGHLNDNDAGTTYEAGLLASLQARLEDADDGVRADAIAELAGLDDDRTVAALAIALSDQQATIRANAVNVLSTLTGELSAHLLEQALTDEDELVREAAIDALIERGNDQAARALAVALRDPAPALRVAAVETLGDFRRAVAVELLRQALTDHDAVVRRTASEVLERLESNPKTEGHD